MSKMNESFNGLTPVGDSWVYAIKNVTKKLEVEEKAIEAKITAKKTQRDNGGSDHPVRERLEKLENDLSRVHRAIAGAEELKASGQKTVALNPHGDLLRQMMGKRSKVSALTNDA